MSTEYFRILLYSYNLSALKRRSSVGRQDQRQYANELSQPRLGSNKLCISKSRLSSTNTNDPPPDEEILMGKYRFSDEAIFNDET
ncbi:unnamed protein product, partial [Rotaria socialis]